MLRLALIAALTALLGVILLQRLPSLGGAYPLQGHDHADLMVAHTPAGKARVLRILFVGNSLTFTNDMPAMLVNIASSDPGNATQLEVQAKTYPGAFLSQTLANTDALAWARTNHPDIVVLQEQSSWYDTRVQDANASARSDWDLATQGTIDWARAVQALGATPIIFEVWGDGAGSDAFARQGSFAYGRTPDQDWALAAEATKRLASQLGAPEAPVGDAFEKARTLPGAPDLYRPDRHHPSVAGSYLAALVFYRQLTGRTGAEAPYHPFGVSAQDAGVLLKASSG